MLHRFRHIWSQGPITASFFIPTVFKVSVQGNNSLQISHRPIVSRLGTDRSRPYRLLINNLQLNSPFHLTTEGGDIKV